MAVVWCVLGVWMLEWIMMMMMMMMMMIVQSLGLGDDLLVVVLLGVGDHGLVSRLPVGGADLSMDVDVLEGLHEPQVLVRVPADGEVVDGGVADDAVLVDDVGGAVGDADVASVAEAAVVSGDGFVEVGDEGDVHGSEAAVLPGLEGVLHVGELGVDRHCDDFAADLPELLGLVVEGDDFGGAHEGEVQRVEEQHHVLAVVGLQVDVHEVSVVPGGSHKGRRGLSDQ